MSSLTTDALMAVFPIAFQQDGALSALGQAAAEVLAGRGSEVAYAALYPHIDALPEPVLDVLARDFKVDWWDDNFTLSEKRRTLKASWRVHKKLGTKAAVDAALSAVYPKSEAVPWFRYDGEPFHYRLEVNTSETPTTLDKINRVLTLTQYYISLRDRFDGVLYTTEPAQNAAIHMGVAPNAIVVTMPVPEVDAYNMVHTLRTGGGFNMVASMPVPEKEE